MTLHELTQRYLDFAADYYRKPDGSQTREALNLADALSDALRPDPSIQLGDLSPRWLKLVQQKMVDRRLARKTINARTHRIRRAINWAVSEEFCQPSVLAKLKSVQSLKRGRSEAKETDGIKPVSEATVWATMAEAPDQLAAMIELHWWTGMRSGELVAMRACDIDRTDEAWVYQPQHHKTEHLDQIRVIILGPRSRTVLKPWIENGGGNPFLFPGIAAERLLWRSAKDRPVNVGTYRHAVRRAAKRAGVDFWTPLQLRHAAATRLERVMGVEAARACLGHSKASTTEIYIEKDRQTAIDAMQLMG